MPKSPSVLIALILAMMLGSHSAHAQLTVPDGWMALQSQHPYPKLVENVLAAAKNNKIGVVTQASATKGAKAVLNKDIAGNFVIGLYHPRFAVRMLEASIAAGIEAPIRVYVTENDDGTSTLSYKKPSFVFAPYMEEGGEALKALAGELDALFEKLTAEAVQ